MDRFLIVANWKANEPIKYDFLPPVGLEIAVAAPHPFIHSIPDQFTRAAQDVSVFPAGAYTGEVSATMLAKLDVKYCLVGHSERRKYLRETNPEVEAKIKQAVASNIIPIICAQTLEEIPENIRNYSPDKFMLMYEPFEAISTAGQYHGENPEKIANTITQWKGKLGLNCRFLYGGSVNPDNISGLLTIDYRPLTGFVVGHASLDTSLFSVIIKKCLPG